MTEDRRRGSFFHAAENLDRRARRMRDVRGLLLLVYLGGLAGCVVCPDKPQGAAVAPACQFTPEQEQLHQQAAADREQRLYEEWQRGDGM
jgi:hypothetical protein